MNKQTVCVCLHVCTPHSCSIWKPGEDIVNLGSEVTGGCAPPDVLTGSRSSSRAAIAVHCEVHLS